MLRYDFKKIVGEGSFGKALLCSRKTDGKACIIKQISLQKMSKNEAKRTEQESTLLAKLSHPNIVVFWESFSSQGSLYIVMEYADGGDLDHYLKSRRGNLLREEKVLHLFVQIALAIKHIHDRKILHRDLKAQNIFLTNGDMVKLGDFGIARVLHNTAELASTQIGTPYYMSPEIMDNKKYNSKTDIWSLGVVLYEIMCLRLPFQGSNIKQLVVNIMRSEPLSPSNVFTQGLRDLLKTMLLKNSKLRPGINNILSTAVVRNKIASFLNEAEVKKEFSHTVLHGANILHGQQSNAQAQPSLAKVFEECKQQPQQPAVVLNDYNRPTAAPERMRNGAPDKVAAVVKPTPASALANNAKVAPIVNKPLSQNAIAAVIEKQKAEAVVAAAKLKMKSPVPVVQRQVVLAARVKPPLPANPPISAAVAGGGVAGKKAQAVKSPASVMERIRQAEPSRLKVESEKLRKMKEEREAAKARQAVAAAALIAKPKIPVARDFGAPDALGKKYLDQIKQEEVKRRARIEYEKAKSDLIRDQVRRQEWQGGVGPRKHALGLEIDSINSSDSSLGSAAVVPIAVVPPAKVSQSERYRNSDAASDQDKKQGPEKNGKLVSGESPSSSLSRSPAAVRAQPKVGVVGNDFFAKLESQMGGIKQQMDVLKQQQSPRGKPPPSPMNRPLLHEEKEAQIAVKCDPKAGVAVKRNPLIPAPRQVIRSPHRAAVAAFAVKAKERAPVSKQLKSPRLAVAVRAKPESKPVLEIKESMEGLHEKRRAQREAQSKGFRDFLRAQRHGLANVPANVSANALGKSQSAPNTALKSPSRAISLFSPPVKDDNALERIRAKPVAKSYDAPNKMRKDYDKDRELMLAKIAERRKAVQSDDNVKGDALLSTNELLSHSNSRKRRDISVVDRGVLASADDASMASEAATEVVNALSLLPEQRSRSADSSLKSSQHLSDELGSTARTAAWIKAENSKRSDSPSSMRRDESEARLHAIEEEARATHGSGSSNENTSRRGSLSSAAAYLGKMAGLLFRRDQKVKPKSPKPRLSLAMSSSNVIEEKKPSRELRVGHGQVVSRARPAPIEQLEEEVISLTNNDYEAEDEGKGEVEDDESDEDAFGSDEEEWRKDLLAGLSESSEDPFIDHDEEDENESKAVRAHDPAAQLQYTLMLQKMQLIMELPPAESVMDEDGFEEESWLITPRVPQHEDKEISEEKVVSIDRVIDFDHGVMVEQERLNADAPIVSSELLAEASVDTSADLNLNAFIEEAESSGDKHKTKLEQIMQLNSYLLKKLGPQRFRSAYEFMKLGEALRIDEDTLLFELERILTVEGLRFLDELFTLLALESE